MGLENLIQAIARVKTLYPDVLLHIAGKGALAETLADADSRIEFNQSCSFAGLFTR